MEESKKGSHRIHKQCGTIFLTYMKGIFTCTEVCVTNNCGVWISLLGLSDVTSIITLGYNNSHIQIFLDPESLNVVCIFCTSLL
jgi:hypothetical protein